MNLHEHELGTRPSQGRENLRGRAEGKGCAVLENLKRYFGVCLKAEDLRRKGFQVRVRGQWQRWLIVIERARTRETALRQEQVPGYGLLLLRGGRYEATGCQRMRQTRQRKLSVTVRRPVHRISRDPAPPPWFLQL